MIAWAPGERLLIYGIGNPGRQDDGLGCRVVAALEADVVPPDVTLETGYQLVPEDALLLADHDVVVFVDATIEPGAPTPYAIRQLETARPATADAAPRAGAFSSHVLRMDALLSLCVQLHGRVPRAYALAVPAYAFDVNAPVSTAAAANLAGALGAVRALLTSHARASNAARDT